MYLQLNRTEITRKIALYEGSKNGVPYTLSVDKEQNVIHILSNELELNFSIEVKDFFGKPEPFENEKRSLSAYYFDSSGNRNNIFYCFKNNKNIFNNITFWRFFVSENEYELYEVGRGKQGTYYCVIANNNTKAIIVKKTKVKFSKTGYELYCENDFPIELLIAINLFIDLTKYKTTELYTNQTLHTLQKDLKNKYDSTFISKIKNQDGIDY